MVTIDGYDYVRMVYERNMFSLEEEFHIGNIINQALDDALDEVKNIMTNHQFNKHRNI